MAQEGIPMPTTSASKPKSNPNEIPLGAKMTDDEIANGIVFKMVTLLQVCAKSQSDAIRVDVGLMWLEFYAECVTFGTTAKTLMKQRGWIRVPPYYYPPGNPTKN